MRRSRGTGPRATKKNAVTHRRARACPSPCGDRGGQAPALRKKMPSLTVGRGPVPRHAAIAGDRPPRYDEEYRPYRRAWALGCQTRMRAGFPRHATIAGDRPPRSEKNAVPRHATIAGDRPPRYDEEYRHYRRAVGKPVPRHAIITLRTAQY